MRCAAVALLLLWPSSAHAAGDVRDEIVRALDAHPLRTDLIVLLDTSGSMAKHFDAVKKFVGDLAQLARPGDTITFISFAERAGDLMPPATVRAGSGTELRARLAKLEPPRGRYTDLGAGLDATLDALLRPGYAPVSIVFLITDFCAEPPPGSAYAGPLIDKGPCRSVAITDALRKKSKQVFSAGDQEVRAFALAIEPSNDQGYAAAGEVLGNLVRVDVAAGDVASALESLRARMQYDRAALAVEKALKHPPTVTQIAGSLNVRGKSDLEISAAAELPLKASFDLRSLRALDGSAGFERSGPHSVRAWVREPWRLGTPEREVPIEATYDLALEPEAALEKLIGRPPRATVVARNAVKLRLEPPGEDTVLAELHVLPRVHLQPGRSTKVELAFTSTLAWAALEASCAVDGEDPITVRAPATIAREVKNDAPPNSWRLAARESRAIPVQADCALTAIDAAGNRLPLGRRTFAIAVILEWEEGVSRTLLLTIAFGLLALAFAYFRELKPRLQPAALSGRLVIYDGPGDFRRLTIPLRGKTRIELEGVAPSSDSGARVEHDRILLPGAGDTKAALYAEKSGKRSVMRLSRLAGEGIKLADEALGPAPVVLRRGRARFSVGEYHCRID